MYSPKANIQVGIRVRPLLPKERASGETEQWTVTPTSITQKDSKLLITSSSYSFNYVFNDETETSTIYEKLVKPMVTSSLEGYNVTIFAYGQTSSGKTFTIRGEESQEGLISLAINDIYRVINENPGEEEFTVRASYMEIYNEVITDLLEPSKGDLDIHESLTRGVFVNDLTERSCHDSKQLFDVFNDGEANRKYGSTIYNEHSSRSHTVFRILLSRKKEDHVCKMSILNFVDLAGSERAGQGGAQGIRLKEAGFINKSLLTLGKVISELSKNQSHISFRESKLTRLLSSSLGGNSQTCILCNVSPNVVDETHLTLQFADRAMTITNRPKVNEVVLVDEKEMKLRCLTRENEDLKQQLKVYQENTSTVTSSSSKDSEKPAADVPTLLGSMRFFKKRAEEYFDELQKEKKVHAELQWEVENVHTRNANLQALDRKNRDRIQELENDLGSVQEKYAVEWSFTMREHERNMAELITYDDMESVTKQLEEEHEKNVQSLQAEHLSMLSAKDSEIERLQSLCSTKSAELEILEENYKNQLALKQAQIQRLQVEQQEQTSVNDSEELEQQKLTIQKLSERCDELSEELEQQITAYQELQEDWEYKSAELEEQRLNVQKVTDRCDQLSQELEVKTAAYEQLEEDWNHKSTELEEQKECIQRVTERCSELSHQLEVQTTMYQQLQEERTAQSAELEEQKLNVQRMTEKYNDLSKELEIKTSMCQQYQGEYNDRSVELKDHQLNLQKITDKCDQLSKELDSKNATCQQLQEQCNCQSAELEELRLNVQTMTEKYNELSKELEMQTAMCQQYQGECDDKSVELKDHQLSIQKLTDRCDQLSNKLESKNVICQQLQEECDCKSAELEEQRASVQTMTEKYNELSKELEIQTAMCEQYQGEYNDRSTELKDHKLSLQNLIDKCQHLSNELENKNATCQKLEEELTECNCNLQQKQAELENCQCACIEAENEFYEASDKIEVLNEKLEEDKEVIAKLQMANKELEVQLKEQLEKYTKLEDSNKQLTQQLKEHSEKHTKLQKTNQKNILINMEDEDSEEYLKSRITYLDTIIERLKRENSGFKRDARDWEMETKKLRKQNESLEFKVECLESSCKSKGQSHSYTHERLREQVGVVEAGMYWDMQREYSTLQAEKENAMAEFERMKQEVLRIRKERDVVIRKYKTLKERNMPA